MGLRFGNFRAIRPGRIWEKKWRDWGVAGKYDRQSHIHRMASNRTVMCLTAVYIMLIIVFHRSERTAVAEVFSTSTEEISDFCGQIQNYLQLFALRDASIFLPVCITSDVIRHMSYTVKSVGLDVVVLSKVRL
jgi:hypothetical protein